MLGVKRCYIWMQRWARVRLDGGGWWGVKSFFDNFFPFYEILAIFIILSFYYEIFMGVLPHCKPFKIFMMGVCSKITMRVPPPSPPPRAHLCMDGSLVQSSRNRCLFLTLHPQEYQQQQL